MDRTKEERPRLVLEFASREERQKFFDTLLMPKMAARAASDEGDPWRLVTAWNLGGR